MKNRASLVLLEQLVMVLVFALAAAICLQIFVKADAISQETAMLGQAQVLAQNGAETLKAAGGDLQETVSALGGSIQDGTLTLAENELVLSITPTPTQIPELGRAEVSVTHDGTALCTLTVGWQEVAQ